MGIVISLGWKLLLSKTPHRRNSFPSATTASQQTVFPEDGKPGPALQELQLGQHVWVCDLGTLA